MQDIDEKEQIPHIFDSRLDYYADKSILNKLDLRPIFSIFANHDKTKEILAQLARNIELIFSEYPENPEKRCRDINYWMDQKIATPGNKIGEDDLKNACVSVFNEIKWNKGKLTGTVVCGRNENPYSSKNDKKLMKALDDYCEIRDNVRCNVLKNEDACLKYNIYMRDKKEKFTMEMKLICDSPGCSWNSYSFGENCALDKMDDTFREINCEALYKKADTKEPLPVEKERSPLEIGFFIIVSFILFYLLILFLEKFTPVGSIIHRFKRRKYNLKRNIERVDDDRYSLYHPDTLPADSENKRYYIEYCRPNN
ncbi:Plasmodium vivax Vir protein, putative [Plasmodium vivax]|nr:Plasmodium vivax Vir protein, putative [Plasmodium vivax]